MVIPIKSISYESQREIFLSRQESFPMQADINMNNNFIQNIADANVKSSSNE